MNARSDELGAVGDLIDGGEADAECAGCLVTPAFGLPRHPQEAVQVAACRQRAVAIRGPAPAELAVVPHRHGVVCHVKRDRGRGRRATRRLGIVGVLDQLEREGVIATQVRQDLRERAEELGFQRQVAHHVNVTPSTYPNLTTRRSGARVTSVPAPRGRSPRRRSARRCCPAWRRTRGHACRRRSILTRRA